MLRPRKRITKRQIKQDKLVTVALKVTDFVNQNSKYLITSVIGVIVVVLAVLVFTKSKKEAEERASLKLTQAIAEYNQQNYNAVIEITTEIVEKYKGTNSAGIATFYLANSYFFKKDYAKALKYYTKYLDDYNADELLSSSSLSGIGACLEQKGEYQQAAQYYERAAKKYSNSFQAPQNYLNAGRCYILAGERDKAEKILKTVLDNYPNARVKTEAELYLAQFQAK